MKKALSLYFQNELHFKILRNNVFYSHKVNLKEQERNKTIILQIIDKITQGRIFKQYFHRLCFKHFPSIDDLYFALARLTQDLTRWMT